MMVAPPVSIVPQTAAPPPPEKDTPAELEARAGADSGYYSGSEANDKATRLVAQPWQRCVPAPLLIAVRLHRAHRPRDPLPIDLQQHVAACWVTQ